MSTPYLTLHPTEQKIPQVGMGTWKLDNNLCEETIYQAIKVGFRHFDAACDYGNEVEVGLGVKKALDEGLVKREDLFITSKLWNTFHAKEHVTPICKKQLKDFGLDYFDLYLIHFPVSLEYVDPSVRYPPGWAYDGKNEVRTSNAPLHETWAAMEELVDAGLVKAIGVSNMQGGLLIDLLRYARIRPSVLQVEHHPYLTQESLIQLAQSENIAVTAYSSFGPLSFRELNWESANEAKILFEHDAVIAIAKNHSRTTAEVLLRWSTQRGLIVIPKATNPELMSQNLHHMQFNLSKEELRTISNLNTGLRFNNPADVRDN
ncbi:NADP-dependent oxidoreductase domain-containing protein [Cytidiella melzeri]|nr:NADP-dependent oxidoreductase domain-containing protein [Cytidiella melzeri]